MTDSLERLIDELDAMVESSRHGCETIPLNDIDPESDHPLAEFVRHGFTQLEVFLIRGDDGPVLATEFSVPLALPTASYIKPELHGKPVEGMAVLVGVGMEGREEVMLHDGEKEIRLSGFDPIEEGVWKALERLHARLLGEYRDDMDTGNGEGQAGDT